MNLSEVTLAYIQRRFNPEISIIILQAFGALEQLGLQYYEDKFIDLVQREDDIEQEDKQDLFILFLKRDLIDVVKEHCIPIEIDEDPTLNELNELVNFIYRAQTLEDYTWISYRINGEGSSRHKLADIIEHYSLLNKARVLCLLGDTVDTFLNALGEFSEDRIQVTTEPQDNRFKAHVDRFMSFLDGHVCLGTLLFKKGYQFQTLDELLLILPYQLQDYVAKNIQQQELQIWLDVVSLMVMTKDNYDAPLLKLTKNMYRITGKPEEIIRLTTFANKLISDFNTYCEGTKLVGEFHDDKN